MTIVNRLYFVPLASGDNPPRLHDSPPDGVDQILHLASKLRHAEHVDEGRDSTGQGVVQIETDVVGNLDSRQVQNDNT